MKKVLSIILSVAIIFTLTACNSSKPASKDAGGDSKTPKSVTITTLNGKREAIQLEVPYNPKRLAVMDLGALDIIDKLELGDRMVGVSKGSSIEYLQSYLNNQSFVNLGTVRKAKLEAVVECNPDVIIIGPRLLEFYDELIKIAPVICLSTDTKQGVVKSTNKNAMLLASLFGKEDKIAAMMAGYDNRIKTLASFAKGKTAVICMANAGGIGILGNNGRCSLIGVEVGFKNSGIGTNIDTSVHGNEASFEFLVSVNPNYIFIMDRDAAIGTKGAKLAKDIMDNELIRLTSAYKNGNIVYLEHSNVWYMAEGGITALGIMLSDLEEGLFKTK